MKSAARKRSPRSTPAERTVRELLLDTPGWLDYVRRALTIPPGGASAYTYFGVNFTADAIKNFKFYFSFCRTLSPAELDVLLPVQDRGRFDEFYAQWHPTQVATVMHRGVTFALKVDLDGTLTHYYHLRVPGMPFGPPERLAIQPSDTTNYHGVCEEFTGAKTHLKRYYYIVHPHTVAHSLAMVGMPRRGPAVTCLEYIESKGRDKVTWISTDQRLAAEVLRKHQGPVLSPSLDAMSAACGFGLFAPGAATDLSDFALYLFPSQWVTQLDGAGLLLRNYLGLRDIRPR